jgi:hypothetical protein
MQRHAGLFDLADSALRWRVPPACVPLQQYVEESGDVLEHRLLSADGHLQRANSDLPGQLHVGILHAQRRVPAGQLGRD